MAANVLQAAGFLGKAEGAPVVLGGLGFAAFFTQQTVFIILLGLLSIYYLSLN